MRATLFCAAAVTFGLVTLNAVEAKSEVVHSSQPLVTLTNHMVFAGDPKPYRVTTTADCLSGQFKVHVHGDGPGEWGPFAPDSRLATICGAW